MSPLPPVHREVLVETDPATAFEVFTAGIGRWWPLGEFSVHGAGSTVAFVDGRIVESSTGERDAVWGSVTRWEPPGALAFSWHPVTGPERAGLVEVTFTATEGGTLVVLEHSGWEAFDGPADARDGYDRGWPVVLGRFGDRVGHLVQCPKSDLDRH